MVKQAVAPDSSRICAECQSTLTFVASWTFRGLWGYDEVHTYECATHGPVFITPRIAAATDARQRTGQSPDNGDRDALIPARRRPTPALNAGAVALPEPESY